MIGDHKSIFPEELILRRSSTPSAESTEACERLPVLYRKRLLRRPLLFSQDRHLMVGEKKRITEPFSLRSRLSLSSKCDIHAAVCHIMCYKPRIVTCKTLFSSDAFAQSLPFMLILLRSMDRADSFHYDPTVILNVVGGQTILYFSEMHVNKT